MLLFLVHAVLQVTSDLVSQDFDDSAKLFLGCHELLPVPHIRPKQKARASCLRHATDYSRSKDDSVIAVNDSVESISLGGRRVQYYAFFNRNIELKGKVVLSRKLMAVVIDADPVTAYEKLFEQPGVAPSYVSLLHTGWQGPMRELLLTAGPAAPQSLIAKWPGGYDRFPVRSGYLARLAIGERTRCDVKLPGETCGRTRASSRQSSVKRKQRSCSDFASLAIA